MLHKQPNSRDCFICGIENPVGPRLAFWQSGERVWSRVVLESHFQGYPGFTHGGIVTAILDETMGRAVIGLRGDSQQPTFALTARLEVEFLRPTPIGVPLVVCGWIARDRRRLFEVEGQLAIEETGQVVATAAGTFARIAESQVQVIRDALPFWEVVDDLPTHQPPLVDE